jgi:transcription elongation GreA/GreB family factor
VPILLRDDDSGEEQWCVISSEPLADAALTQVAPDDPLAQAILQRRVGDKMTYSEESTGRERCVQIREIGRRA